MSHSIRMHLEVKMNNEWHHYSNPYYIPNPVNNIKSEFYNLVAGIYDSSEMVHALRGLPADASVLTKACYEYDGKMLFRPKSVGYVNAEELDVIQMKLKDYGKENCVSDMECDLDFGVLHTLIGDNSVVCHHGFDDVRLIFWFD